jgi:hypothetical protein
VAEDGTNGTVGKTRFLSLFRKHRSVVKAARVMQVGRRTVYNWREDDPLFALAWDEIETELLDDLEDSALKRATRGHVEPVFGKDGTKIGKRRKFETALTIFMLKARRGDRYRFNDREDEDGPDVARNVADLTAREADEEKTA